MMATTSDESIPPGQKRPERYVGFHAHADRVVQQRVELIDRFRSVPVNGPLKPSSAARLADQYGLGEASLPNPRIVSKRSRAQLVDAFVDGMRRGNVIVAEIDG